MTQIPGGKERPSAADLRAQHKDVMRAALLEVASELVAEEGEAALTMQAVAVRFGSSVGMLYRLVESKDDLLSAVRSARVQDLAQAADAAVAAARVRLDAAGLPSRARSLAEVLVAARFWIAAGQRDAASVEVLRDLLLCGRAPTDRAAADPALRALSTALEAAAARGALRAGSARARAATVVIVGALAAPTIELGGDPEHPPGLGDRLLDALLVGWVADPEAWATVDQLLS